MMKNEHPLNLCRLVYSGAVMALCFMMHPPVGAQSDGAPAEPASGATQESHPESQTGEASIPSPSGERAVVAFDDFKLILERNIFDPNRRGARERQRETRRPEPPREESFTLLGTMFYADKQLAFFEGTRSDWSGAVKIGEIIEGHMVVEIDFDKIVLEKDGQRLDLEVGAARVRQGEDPWQSRHRDEWVVKGTRSGNEASDTATSSTDASSGADLSALESNDILKQLMERRKNQLSQ